MSADLLDLTVRELLERVLGAVPAAEADPWVDAKEQPLVPHRELHAAAKRGEIELYRSGRRYLLRQSALDRFIARPEHRVGAEVDAESAEPESTVAHILRANGFARRSAGGAK